MNLQLRFSDCEVASVSAAHEAVVIRLSAANVHQEGPRGERSEGFARGVLLVLHGTSPPESTGHLIGRIAQGRVGGNGHWAASIPLPTALSGPIALELSLANHAELVLAASRIECCFEAGANFSESLFC